jgi:BirA family biotin operon repressor/biotin-[acetyl-CoA-carboxylase] ligase
MSQPHYQPKENREAVLDYTILRYDTVSSTNEVAKEIAKKSVEERIVIVAEEQTMGKGRLNRQWISPRGGLWLSIVMRPQISPKEAVKLNFMTSSAVARTIQGMFGLRTEVKWPNDVLVNGRKICGILTESNNKGDGVDFVVVGIGANVNVDLEAFPKGLRDSVTSLKYELGYGVDRKSLTTSLLQNFEDRYRRLQQGLWNGLLYEWKSLATFLGEQVEVDSFEEVFVGEAWDVDDDGALIIRFDNGVLRKIVAADVTLRRRI